MSKFTKEDLVPHVTSAAVFKKKLKKDGDVLYLIMDHVKHNMLTFPIGKCKEGEEPFDGLCTEVMEELGVDICWATEACTYNKTYDFDGVEVPIETHVYDVHLVKDGTYTNREPDKCRGIMWMTEQEILSCNRKIADCVLEYFKSKRAKCK